MKRTKPLPANYAQPNGIPVVHYSIEELHNILLILAFDKPLWISLNTSNGIGMINTTSEPIGDLETA
jgi:hypothetical protein